MTTKSEFLEEEVEEILEFFQYSHLPNHLQAVSRPFCELATKFATTLPTNNEKVMALRNLLLAKDCAVRAVGFTKKGII